MPSERRLPPASFRWRCQVRRWVVATRALHPLWRLAYRLAERLVVWRLSRLPGLCALYLRRGVAKGELRPGVSDLDFTAVLESPDPAHRARLERAYAALASWIPFLESELTIRVEAELASHWTRPENQYRWAEARSTWKLLAGRSVLEAMPVWPEPAWAGLHREIKVWLNVWAENLLIHPWRHQDDVYRNATCYKLLCEFLKVELSCFEGRHTYWRGQALSWCRLDHPWLAPLRRCEERRFLAQDEEFAEWTWVQILGWLEYFRQGLSVSGYGGPGKGFSEVRLGDPEFSPASLQLAESWSSRARQIWRERLLGVELTTSLNFPPQEPVLLLRVDPQRPPSMAQIRSWLAGLCGQGVHPYLAFGRSALALLPNWHVSDNTWLTVQENPDALACAGEAGELGYNPLMLQYFSTRWGRAVDASSQSEAEFERNFWWSAQMAVVFAHACQYRLVVPRGFAAICDELEGLGMPLDPRATRAERQAYLVRLWGLVKARPFRDFY